MSRFYPKRASRLTFRMAPLLAADCVCHPLQPFNLNRSLKWAQP